MIGAYAYGSERDLEELSQELEDPQQALELSPDDNIPGDEIPRTLVQVFARSFDALSHDAQQLFTALAAFATAEFGRRAALALGTALGLADPREATDLLVRRALVGASVNHSIPEQGDRERRALHPLTRAFATHKFGLWPQERQDIVHHALASFYATYAASLTGLSERVLEFDEVNINGKLEWACNQEQNELVVRLCMCMRDFWRNGGRRTTSLTYLPLGIDAAEKLAKVTHKRADSLAQAALAYAYGQVFFQIGKPDEAAKFYMGSLTIYQTVGETPYQTVKDRSEVRDKEGVIRAAFSRLSLSMGHMEEAKRYCQQALAIHRETKNRTEEGVDLSSFAQIAIDCGQLGSAEGYLQQAQQVDPNRLHGRGRRIDCLEWGRIAMARKRLDEAEHYFQEALEISQNQSGKEKEMDRRGEAASLSCLGQVALERCQLEKAKQLLQQALAIHREVQDREGEGVVLSRLAHLAEAQDELENAEKQYQASLDIFRTAQLGRLIPNALLEFGRFLIERRGRQEEGCSMLLQAAQLYDNMGIHSTEMDLPSKQKAQEIAQRLGCSWQGTKKSKTTQSGVSYEVVLSFAGEDREYVDKVADFLRKSGVKVFYDKYEEVELWGKDLSEFLGKVYGESARYCVMFISKHYADKVWTNHEKRHALARALNEKKEYILPARFDQTSIEGLSTTVAYVDLSRKAPYELGEMILLKLRETGY